LWESNTIVRYLAATHALGTLMPDDARGRAQAEMWMDWQQTVMLPGITPVFWNLIRTPEDQRNSEAIDQGAAKVREGLARLDRQLDGHAFINGDAMTVADIPLGCVAYRWYALPVDHGHFPNVHAWYQRLAGRSAYQEHVMQPLT